MNYDLHGKMNQFMERGEAPFIFWVCLLMLLSPAYAYSQEFELTPPEFYSFEPVFTKSYITQNRIKAIHASLVYKHDNQPIEDKGLRKCWEYDTDGLLKRYYATSVKGFTNIEIPHTAIYRRGRRISPAYISLQQTYLYDTTFTSYYYNTEKRLIIRRTRDGDYYTSVYYEYDDSGNIRKQTVFRETNASENKNEFRLGVQNLLSSEEFRYEKNNALQSRRRHFNDEGKEYKQTIYNYDSLGRLKEENNSFTVSWMRASLKLEYDKAGRLSKKLYASNENGDETSKSEYVYNTDNLPDIEKRFKGDQLCFEFNYIYDRKNKMLLSHFVREDLNKAIVIVKYAYDTY
jgi:hypothetical protein